MVFANLIEKAVWDPRGVPVLSRPRLAVPNEVLHASSSLGGIAQVDGVSLNAWVISREGLSVSKAFGPLLVLLLIYP